MQEKDTEVRIDWDYHGKPDPLLGTGASRAETAIVWIAGIAAVLLYVYLYFTHTLDWTWWQYVVAGIIAFDVGGGVVANSLNSCKRFYHTPVRDDEPGYVRAAKNHLLFTALHVYPIVVGLLYRESGWGWGLFWYVVLVGSAALVMKIPLYLRRPVAMLIILLVLGVNLYGVAAVRGFEWLMPALFLKIVYGHLVKEEPYRPVARREVAA
jgi:hypothetical protein